MNVMDDIAREGRRQEAIWGRQDHSPTLWIAIAIEELGEAAKAVLEGHAIDYRREMVQVAAVAISALECFDRGNWAILDDVTRLQKENDLLRDLIAKHDIAAPEQPR